MFKAVKVYKLMSVGRVIDTILSQKSEYPISLSYNLHKLKKTYESVSEHVLQRLSLVFGEQWEIDRLTEQEIVIYNMVMSSEVEIEIPEIDVDKLMSDDSVRLNVEDVGVLLEFFSDTAN